MSYVGTLMEAIWMFEMIPWTPDGLVITSLGQALTLYT